MDINYRSITDLKGYENNAKKHTIDQVQMVANSIEQFGFVQPIVIDSDGVIVIGHCRYRAAVHLGLQEVPCLCVDDLTPEQIKALRLADNKTNESEWDMELLRQELDEIFDIDMKDFGFGEMPVIPEVEAIDLDNEERKDKAREKQECHCPKCGFVFEV